MTTSDGGGEGAPVTVRTAVPAHAEDFLAGLERASGVPPVDEDERRRLAGLRPARDPGWRWTAHLVHAGERPVAYAGIRVDEHGRPGEACTARVDLAFDRAPEIAQRALGAALEHVRDHAPVPGEGGAAPRLEAWLRGATAEDLTTAGAHGFAEHRRLHVLGVRSDAVAGAVPDVPADLRLRTFDPDSDADADAVVRLLTRTYGTPPEHFATTFPTLRAADWFRPDDLLLLEERWEDAQGGVQDGGLVALHWMKRRGDGIGEVYNLAVDPGAQGRGLGALLLDAGLAHLAATGCREVVLWVAADNPRALALYRSRGFTLRWDDVSLAG